MWGFKLGPSLVVTDTRGYVYFILDGDGFVKVGYSGREPSERMATLQTGSPRTLQLLGWYRGTSADERRLHRLFKADHVRGEWFAYSDTIKRFLINTTSL